MQGTEPGKTPCVHAKDSRILNFLGPVAKPAVPTLLKALEKDDAFHEEIVQALEKIGCDTDELMPPLVRMVEKQQAQEIVFANLTRLGPKAKPAVPALLASLKDAKRLDTDAALKLLEKLEVEPERVIPILIEGMKKDPKQKDVCDLTAFDTAGLDYLGRLGPKAKSAVPGIVQALKVIDDALGNSYSVPGGREVRKLYIDALGQIGPAARDALPLLKKIAARYQENGYGEAAGTTRRAIATIQGEKKRFRTCQMGHQ